MPDQVFLTLAPSHTKGRMVELIVSPEYLAGGEKVLIIDDFLASGATVVGVGTLVEKAFEGGREVLKPLGVPVESLVCITSMEDGQIIIGDCR
jgi:xanthine phosphoribosyltransferase